MSYSDYNTTFYSNSQSLAEIRNELLEAKLVNRIILTSVTEGKKLILIPLSRYGQVKIMKPLTWTRTSKNFSDGFNRVSTVGLRSENA